MKKLIAIIMALAILFCVTACSGAQGTGAKKDDEIIIGFNTNQLTNETMTFMVDVFKTYGEEHNIKIMVSEDGGDTATLLTNLENFVAGGVDGIIFMNYDPVGVAPMLEDLKEKGIPVVSYDEYSDLCDYSFLCSNTQLGTAIGEMAADWANANLEGPVEVALIGVDVNGFLKERGDAIEAAVKANIPDCTVYRENLGGGGASDPVTIFANMTSAHPGIRVLVSVADACVVAPAEAWYGDLVGMGADISQYGVFATDATDIALNLINKSKTNEAVMRGSIDLGLKDVVPLGMISCLHAAIEGRESGYPKENYYNIKLVTAENVDEYVEYLNE